MDEGAFVDSLLAPDMRAASASVAVALGMQPLQSFAQELTGVGERKRPGSRRRTPAASGMKHPQQFGQLPPPDDAIGRGGASTADFDDSLFRQLMGSSSGGGFGPDADETGSLPPLSTSSLQMTLAALASSSVGLASKDSAVENPPTSTNSLMFEPLELPKGGITAPLDQSFKDAFGAPVVVQDGADSPVVSPPNSACSLRSLASVFQGDPCATPRSPVYSDPSSMMPVQPLSSTTYFASSSMATSNGFASNAPSFSMAAASPAFWMNTSHSTPNGLMRGMMDGFDSSSPPVSMRQMLLMSSGVVSPPSSTGSGVGLPFSTASLLTLQHAHLQQQQQQQQFAMWTQSSAKTQARPTRTPTATTSANRGKKRARARQISAPSEPLSILVPSLSPTSESDKQLVVSADMHGKNSDPGAEGSSSSRTTKRPRTSRVRSPSTVSPVAMLTPTASPSGSASDGDMSSTARSTKGKKCVEPGCTRRAQSNSRCKAHGGGARCQFAGPGGCSRSSQGGGFCRAHGGGKRCEFPGCVRGQQRKGRCYVHGGIRRCQWAGCEKKDRGNGFCISHGGGKRCEREGCARAVRRGKLCQLHDGSRQDE